MGSILRRHIICIVLELWYIVQKQEVYNRRKHQVKSKAWLGSIFGEKLWRLYLVLIKFVFAANF